MLTQIRNIRKTILPTQMPLIIFKTNPFLPVRLHVTLAPSFPPPLYTSQPLTQVRRVELVTALTQGAS